MSESVFRFAPSPNGYLHLGHAYSALLNARLAADAEGRLLLRIEDIDLARAEPEYERAIVEDLAWLGIRFEPEIRRQSEHFDDYRAALEALRDEGINIKVIATSEIKISVLIDRKYMELAVQALHDAFGLDKAA